MSNKKRSGDSVQDSSCKRACRTITWHGHRVPADCEFERLPLAIDNAHPRDQRIVFRDRDHVYYIDGEVGKYTSVTTVIHQQFPVFDSTAVATAMVRRPAFQSADSRYAQYQSMILDTETGESVSESLLVQRITAAWTANGSAMADLGTTLHRDIELYYNKQPVTNTTSEYKYFLAYARRQEAEGMVPWRTEITVFGETERICGSVDMIFKDNNGRYRLRDWKRSKKISYHGFGKYGKDSLASLPDCNFSHYTLQLNLYKFLLEKYYDIVIFDMGLVVFHPNNDSYQEYEILPAPVFLSALLELHGNKYKT